ncbi:MAG: glycosyltransferase [Rickettsiales bacterium]|jgi:glycosyltransferase involved in cell wall biosynthesis|nr:glycosyltransferase [Rickettsiales bacterium]
MKISVIIPVFNVEKYIAQCLENLVLQTHKNIEIIIVDDASEDKSLEIAREYARRDPRIKIIALRKNGGVSAARNRGLAAAKGAFAHFHDPDDFVNLEYYEAIAAAVKIAPKSDVVLGGIESEHRNIRSFSFERAAALRTMEEKFARFYAMCTPFVFRRDFLNENKLRFMVGQKIGEDTIFAVRAIAAANRVLLAPGALYHYMVSRGSAMTGAPTAEKLSQLIFAHDFQADFFKKHNLTSKERLVVLEKTYRVCGIPLLRVKNTNGGISARLLGFIKISEHVKEKETMQWVARAWYHWNDANLRRRELAALPIAA